MAESPAYNGLLEPSACRLCPAHRAMRPVISKIPPPVPFSDWSYPSLPTQGLTEKMYMQHRSITALGISTCRKQLDSDSTVIAVHKHAHTLPKASATEEMQHVPCPSFSDRSSFTSNSITEELPVLTCSRNKTGNCSIGSDIVNDESPLHQHTVGLSTIPTLNLLSGKDTPFDQTALGQENYRIQSFDHDSRPPSMTPALLLESEVSESGWTEYFDLSSGEWTSHESILAERNMVESKDLTSGHRTNLASRGEQEVEKSDDSMASDASSGPKWLIGDSCLVAHRRLSDAPPTSKRSFNDAAPHVTEILHCGQPKLRRLQNKKIQSLALEDTATSPLQECPYEMEFCESEASRKSQNGTGSTASRKSSQWQSQAINDRLEVLQALVPDAVELSQEEILNATMEYVRALELKVKICLENPIVNFGSTSSLAAKAANSAMGLLERGVCLMPLSLVAPKVP